MISTLLRATAVSIISAGAAVGFAPPTTTSIIIPPGARDCCQRRPLRQMKHRLQLLPASSLTEDIVDVEDISYPVQIYHEGRCTTIHVRKNEPILQALERQSTFSTSAKSSYDDDGTGNNNDYDGGLALSNIPHECRRGNCLTCSSRLVRSNNSHNHNGHAGSNIQANVDNGLSPAVATELTKSGYVLTCCSYVTGPGVVLELDQNHDVWDLVYRQRICADDAKRAALEAQARSLRRADEDNLGQWKDRLEEKLGWDKR